MNIFEWNMISPMSTNMITVVRGNEVTEVYILRTSWWRPGIPPHRKNAPTILMAIKQKATGNPVSKRSDNAPKIMIKVIHHSIL